MKALKFILLLMAGLAAASSSMAQTESGLVIPLSAPGKPFKVEVNLLQGSINISEYDGKDVVIDIPPSEAEKRRAAENSTGMRRIGGGMKTISATEKDNQVTVTSGSIATNYNLKIKIPKGASNIKLSTVNGGGITATDISGAIETNNTNGGIKLSNVSGSVVANTLNGNITVVFKSIDPKAPMAFSSFNGRVDVTLPVTIKANVKLHTDQGDIMSDFDVAVDANASAPSATKTKDGSFRFGDAEWITGKIGGGGPEFMMKTFNGNIYIRKAK